MKHNNKKVAALLAAKANVRALQNFSPDKSVTARYNPAVRAAQGEGVTTLNIYSTIGEYWDWDTGMMGGITGTTVSKFLDNADGKDVVININSPGGDYFEGLAIYNLLDQYEGQVDVRVIGMAASAASFLAMAGDTIEIAKAGFFMIHNAMTIAIGNRHDMQECGDMLAQLDEVMAGIYIDHTGQDSATIASMLDAETWINGEDAVALGFADKLLGEKDVVEDDEEVGHTRATKRIDRALASAGVSRKERRALMEEFLHDAPAASLQIATPRAGNSDITPRADDDQSALLSSILAVLKTT